MSKLTKERVGTRLHGVDARGWGILQEMAHKVDCLWGCSRSEYLVGRGGRERERKEEVRRRGRGRERSKREDREEEGEKGGRERTERERLR